MKLKEVIKSLQLNPEDRIFIRRYQKDDEEVIQIQDIDKATLNRKVKIAQHYYGGMEYAYNCWRFILE